MNGFRRNRTPTSCIPDWAEQYQFEPFNKLTEDAGNPRREATIERQSDIVELHSPEVAAATDTDAQPE